MIRTISVIIFALVTIWIYVTHMACICVHTIQTILHVNKNSIFGYMSLIWLVYVFTQYRQYYMLIRIAYLDICHSYGLCMCFYNPDNITC